MENLQAEVKDKQYKPLIMEALEEAKAELVPLTKRQNELTKRLEEIEDKTESEEDTQKRLNVLGRKLEEAEVEKKAKVVDDLKRQINEIQANSELRKKEINEIELEVERIETERKKIVKALLQSVHPQIKQTFVGLLDCAISWIEQEGATCERVADQFQVRTMLTPSFFREFRIFNEGVFRKLRDRLDRYLP